MTKVSSYRPTPEIAEAFGEYMEKLSKDVEKQTNAPPDVCALCAIEVLKVFIETALEVLEVEAEDESKGETIQ